MPNRLLKGSICTSEDYASLSLFQRDVFIRLIVTVDDFGRTDARSAILKGKMFPLDSVTAKSIDDALAGLATRGMVFLYEVDGRPYLELPSWTKHQQVRSKVSKFPAPEERTTSQDASTRCNQMISDDIGCNHMISDAPVIQNPESRIRNPESEVLCAEHGSRRSTPDADAPTFAAVLTLADGSGYGVTPDDAKRYADLYPAVDVGQQLRNMIGWLDANPKNRKTRAGIRKFINGWLSREQNRARPTANARSLRETVNDDTPLTENPYTKYLAKQGVNANASG